MARRGRAPVPETRKATGLTAGRGAQVAAPTARVGRDRVPVSGAEVLAAMHAAAQAPRLRHGDVENTQPGATALAPRGSWPSELPVPVVEPETGLGVTGPVA